MRRFKPYFRKVIMHMVIWTLAFWYITFMRDLGNDAYDPAEDPDTLIRVVFLTLLGCVAGVVSASYSQLMEKWVGRKHSFGYTVLLNTLGYLMAITLILIVASTLYAVIMDKDVSLPKVMDYVFSRKIFAFTTFCLTVGFFIAFISEVDRKFGPGNLWKMLSGKYYHPVEEYRVLMFLDMRSSTTIA